MKQPVRLLIIAGARPNFMKVAPLIRAIQRHNASLGTDQPSGPASDADSLSVRVAGGEGRGEVDSHRPPPSVLCPQSSDDRPPSTVMPVPICYKLVHTGQHYDAKMSDVFFEELGIPAPHVHLDVGSGSHAQQTAAIMTAFEPVLSSAFAPVPQPSALNPQPSSLPDWVVVVGDVNSTMACALVASKLGVRVAHVEAGLRSFDRTMPEEVNRLVTDALADLLLTPSADADENLRREGVPEAKIRLVGNIMIDTLVANLEKARSSPILNQLSLTSKGFAYVTLHRPSNVDGKANLEAIMHRLHELARNLPVVFPMHPRTRRMLDEFGLSRNGHPSLMVLEPVGYHDSVALTENARFVLTDSGGLQEESTYLGTPCLTLRPNTERPVTITMGSNKLTTLAELDADIAELMNDRRTAKGIPPLWDGHSAQRIIQALITS